MMAALDFLDRSCFRDNRRILSHQISLDCRRHAKMIPAMTMIMIVTVSVIVTFAVMAAIFQSSIRITYWILQAAKAMDSRDYNKVEYYCRKLSRIHSSLRDPDRKVDIEFLSEHGLGYCFQARDDFVTSERHFARAVELWEQGSKEKHGVVANVMAELAIAQHAQGKTVESEQTIHRLRELCEVAVESDVHQIAEMVIGAANGAAFRNFNELAFSIARIGQLVLERTDVWYDGAMAHTQIALASFHMLHCEYGSARKLVETALQCAGDELAREDADNARSILGQAHLLSGDPEAAIKEFECSLEIRSADWGEEHWRTSITIGMLADVHRASGEYHKAKNFSDTAWRLQSDQLPVDDAIRAGTAVSRAMLLIDFGIFEEADQMLADAEEMVAGGIRGALLAGIRLIQGIGLHTRFRYDQAAKMLQVACEIAEETYGHSHRMMCDFYTIQGANLIQLGEYDKAETILTDTLAIRESLPDVSVIDLADLLWIQAGLFVKTDRISAAESAVFRAREIIDNRVAATHLIRAEISETIGRIRHAQSDFEGALVNFNHALDVRQKIQRPDHPSFAKLLEAHACTLASVGEAVKADQQRERAAQIRELYCDQTAHR